MARDYKNRSSRKGAAGSRLTGLLIFVAGLVTGLCVAIGFVLLKGLPTLQTDSDDQQQAAVITGSPDKKDESDSTSKTEQEDSDVAEAKSSPKFDFYTILPEMEVSVPEWEEEAEAPAPEDEVAPEDAPATSTVTEEKYILQIGSFRQPGEAERVKAELALLGIGTEIQRVVIDGGDVWHRVRAGPYEKPDQLKQMRQRLIENDVDFMLLKLKEDSN